MMHPATWRIDTIDDPGDRMILAELARHNKPRKATPAARSGRAADVLRGKSWRARPILEYIQDHPGVTTGEIAEALGVDRRTVICEMNNLTRRAKLGLTSTSSGNGRELRYALPGWRPAGSLDVEQGRGAVGHWAGRGEAAVVAAA